LEVNKVLKLGKEEEEEEEEYKVITIPLPRSRVTTRVRRIEEERRKTIKVIVELGIRRREKE
jgi:hypothetical protein